MAAPAWDTDGLGSILQDIAGALAGISSRLSGEVALVDGPTPALDASQGRLFTLDSSQNPTLAVPSNPPPAGSTQAITIAFKAIGANRTLSLNAAGFAFTADIVALTATAVGYTDYITCIWNSAMSKWVVVGYTKGA